MSVLVFVSGVRLAGDIRAAAGGWRVRRGTLLAPRTPLAAHGHEHEHGHGHEHAGRIVESQRPREEGPGPVAAPDSGSFRSLAACATEARETILSLPAGGFGDAKVGGQQSPTKLVAERGVSTRQTTRDRVAEAQGVPRDMEGVETMVVEGPWRSAAK